MTTATLPQHVADFLARLKGVRQSGENWQAFCPAHENGGGPHKPSLSVKVGTDGTILLNCHANKGCTAQTIVSALGLELTALFPPKATNGRAAHASEIAATYDYTNAQGDLLYQAVRMKPKDFRQRQPNDHGGWTWNLRGVPRVLYRLPELLTETDRLVFLVEGEKDADRLRGLGLLATCNAMGAGKWEKSYTETLTGRHVVILPDNDDPGREHAETVARALCRSAASVRVVAIEGLPPGGDVSDWLDAGHAPDELVTIAHDSPEWAPVPGDDVQAEMKTDDGIPMMTSEEFAVAEFRRSWLVRGVLIENEPCIIGGPRKAMKTSILTDLAISISTGTKFLGQFPVERRRVGFMSGESGKATIQETAQRQCRQKGRTLAQAGVHWGFELPQLSLPEHLAKLRRTIETRGLQVVLIDPLYLCLLAGNRDAQASNLFDMGPILGAAAQTCLSVGCTPTLCHHTRKTVADPFDPPELEDLAFAGIQEFARQWLLVGRRRAYEPGTGEHTLWLNIGGSAGFSGCWGVDISEGVIDDEFSGRHWDVTVRTAADVRGEAAAENEAKREQAKAARSEAKDEKDCQRLTEVLGKLGPSSISGLADAAGMSYGRGKYLVGLLIDQQSIVPCEFDAPCGKGTRKQSGVCVAHPDTPTNTPTVGLLSDCAHTTPRQLPL